MIINNSDKNERCRRSSSMCLELVPEKNSLLLLLLLLPPPLLGTLRSSSQAEEEHSGDEDDDHDDDHHLLTRLRENLHQLQSGKYRLRLAENRLK